MILTKLKHRTLWHQQQMEKNFDLFHSVQTFDDYRHLLEKYLGFYEPIEDALEAILYWTVMDLDFQPRKKAPLLIRDLHSLGVNDTLLPQRKMMLKLDTLPRAWAAYTSLKARR